MPFKSQLVSVLNELVLQKFAVGIQMHSVFSFLLFLGLFFRLHAQPIDFKLIHEAGKVGLASEDGTILIPPAYDAMGWSNQSHQPANNVIGYNLAGRWGLISLSNKKVTNPSFTQLYPSGHLFAASKKGKYSAYDFLGLINDQGKNTLPYKYTSVNVVGSTVVVSIKSKTGYTYGLVDLGGKLILPITFKEIRPLGHLRFAAKGADNKIFIYNDKGDMIASIGLDGITDFSNGFAKIYDNHLVGLMNTEGSIKVAPAYKDVRMTNTVETLAFDQWEFIAGNETIRSWSFDHVEPIGDQYYRVTANNYQWVVNMAGDNMTPPHYQQVEAAGESAYVFKHRKKWGVLQNNEVLIKPIFDSLFSHNDMFYAHDGSKWSLYDAFGIRRTVEQYDRIAPETDHYFAVSKNNRWGYIDRTGAEVIPCVFEEVSAMTFDNVVVKFHGQYGIIDKQANWIVTPQNRRLNILNAYLYLAYDDALTMLKSYAEGIIYFTENEVEVRDSYLLEYISNGGLWKIDFKGRIVNREIPQQHFEEIRAASEGLFAVKYNDRFGFVDDQNRLIVANRYEDVGNFSEDLVSIRLLGRWGFIDRQENIAIQPNYEWAGEFHRGMAIVKDETGYGLIDQKGKRVSAFGYDSIILQPNNRYIIVQGKKRGLLASDGSLLINAKYDYLEELGNGYTKVSLFGKYGVLAPNGSDNIPIVYDQITYDPRHHQYLARKKSIWEKHSE